MQNLLEQDRVHYKKTSKLPAMVLAKTKPRLGATNTFNSLETTLKYLKMK